MFFQSRSIACSLAVAASAAVAACSPNGQGRNPTQSGGAAASQSAPAVPVTTATVEQRPMPLVINVVGTVEASSSVAVRSQITGLLTSVSFREGEDVAAGQVLFTLDRRPLEATLAQVEATLARDTAQATNAQAIAARQQDLQARGIATKEQADQSRTTAAALEATLEADRAAVELARVQLQYATILSPISGRTGALIVNEGNLVRANDATPLVVINQVSPVNVAFGLPEGQLQDLRRYMAQGAVRVEAGLPSDEDLSSGRVTFIDNTVDAATGQIKVKASFPNASHRLWPGQFVNVSVVLATDPQAVVVPTAAVQDGQEGQYVFVVNPDMAVDLRPITVERQAGGTTVVRSGLRPDEVVVTDGQLRLVAGTKVSLRTGTEAQP